jgi:amino acid transporter
MYGVVFILLGNLSGNAISLGLYVMGAAGKQNPPKRDVIGIAIAALTIAIMLHIFSRRGGIMMNNFFAVTKVLILLAIIILGFIKASGDKLGGAPPSTAGFAPDKSFQTNRHDVASYTDSFFYVVYTYSGFEQPFYVLSKVSRPRKVFPKYTLIAMLIAATFFVLVNIAYFCAVPKDLQGIAQAQDMATLFFGQMFGDGGAKRVMAALIAYSIFGNIVVMTFTAARVKQEIAKEGILPSSLFFATAHTTTFAHLKDRCFPSSRTDDEHLEQAPMAALGLHWVSSVFLIAITSMLDAGTAYSVLVSLYSYVIIVLNGFFVAGGLLLKFTPSKNWKANANITFWLNPLHAIVYFVVCGFLLFAAFAKPSAGSPYSRANSHLQWYVVPAIGLSALTWGMFWYGGLRLVMLKRMKELVVTRHALVVPDKKVPGQFIQKAEIVGHEWHTEVPSSHSSVNEHEMYRMA